MASSRHSSVCKSIPKLSANRETLLATEFLLILEVVTIYSLFCKLCELVATAEAIARRNIRF